MPELRDDRGQVALKTFAPSTESASGELSGVEEPGVADDGDTPAGVLAKQGVRGPADARVGRPMRAGDGNTATGLSEE